MIPFIIRISLHPIFQFGPSFTGISNVLETLLDAALRRSLNSEDVIT